MHGRLQSGAQAAQIQQDHAAEEVPPAQADLQGRGCGPRGNLPCTQAAHIAGINFLTAKTILFFHKNNCKSYQFDLGRRTHEPRGRQIAASYSAVRKLTDINDKLIKPKSRIEVICSIGNVLSPPKGQCDRSPTTCSNCWDKYAYNLNSFIIKPSPIHLERGCESAHRPTCIVGQDYATFDLKAHSRLQPSAKNLSQTAEREEHLRPCMAGQ